MEALQFGDVGSAEEWEPTRRGIGDEGSKESFVQLEEGFFGGAQGSSRNGAESFQPRKESGFELGDVRRKRECTVKGDAEKGRRGVEV